MAAILLEESHAMSDVFSPLRPSSRSGTDAAHSRDLAIGERGVGGDQP
jgi:hypothetical protein